MVDAAGRVVPDAVQHVKLTVEGEATLAGIASANPHNVDSFQRGDHFTYHGKALGIVRPTGSPGRILVHASAEGLAPATLTLKVNAVNCNPPTDEIKEASLNEP